MHLAFLIDCTCTQQPRSGSKFLFLRSRSTLKFGYFSEFVRLRMKNELRTYSKLSAFRVANNCFVSFTERYKKARLLIILCYSATA
jgi:hypothetical protein